MKTAKTAEIVFRILFRQFKKQGDDYHEKKDS